jgi:4-amino-4-deoxy-L-arabinose transferase-like glycosyltransferase
MSFIIACIYFGSNYLTETGNLKKLWHLLIYGLLLCLGALAKLPSAYLLIVFLILFLDKKISLTRKIYFSIASILAIIPVFAWYFYWVPHLVTTYGFWHFSMGINIIDGASEIINNLGLAFELFYNNALKYLGFFAFVIGVIYSILKKQKILLAIFGLSFFSYLIIVLKSGHIFYENNYYIIPFVPIMSLVASFGIAQFKNKKIALLFIIAIAAEGILNQQHDFLIKEDALALLNLEKDLATIAQAKDLIAVNSKGQPTPIYFSTHKGWAVSNGKLQDKSHVKSLQKKGLKFIIIFKKVFGTAVFLNYPIVLENENYSIYRLN